MDEKEKEKLEKKDEDSWILLEKITKLRENVKDEEKDDSWILLDTIRSSKKEKKKKIVHQDIILQDPNLPSPMAKLRERKQISHDINSSDYNVKVKKKKKRFFSFKGMAEKFTNMGNQVFNLGKKMSENLRKNTEIFIKENFESGSNSSSELNLPKKVRRFKRKKLFITKQVSKVPQQYFSSFKIERIFLAEFDLEIGSRIVTSYPQYDENTYTTRELSRILNTMIPDGSHLIHNDFIAFFHKKKSKNRIKMTMKEETNEKKDPEDEGEIDSDSDEEEEFIIDEGGEFYYCYSLVMRKSSEKFQRKSKIKSLMIMSKENYIYNLNSIMKQVLNLIFNFDVHTQHNKTKNEIENNKDKLENEKIIKVQKLFQNFFEKLNNLTPILSPKKISIFTRHEKHILQYVLNPFTMQKKRVRKNDNDPKNIEEKFSISLFENMSHNVHVKMSTFSNEIPSNFTCSIVRLIDAFKMDTLYIFFSILYGKKTLFLGNTVSRIQKGLNIMNLVGLEKNEEREFISAGLLSRYVISSMYLVPFVNLLKGRIMSYVNIDISNDEMEKGFIGGTLNPIFENRKECWDVLCMIENGICKVKEEAEDHFDICKSDKKFFKSIIHLIEFMRNKKEKEEVIEMEIRIKFRSYSLSVMERIRRELCDEKVTGIYSYDYYMKKEYESSFNDLNKIEHIIKQLKGFEEEEESLIQIFQYLRKELDSPQRLLEFISYFERGNDKYEGGLYPLAVYVFHKNDTIRAIVCFIIQSIEKLGNKIGRRLIDNDVNFFLYHSFSRNLNLFKMDHVNVKKNMGNKKVTVGKKEIRKDVKEKLKEVHVNEK